MVELVWVRVDSLDPVLVFYFLVFNYRNLWGLRASGFKGIALNYSDMKPGGIKFESDAVVL